MEHPTHYGIQFLAKSNDNYHKHTIMCPTKICIWENKKYKNLKFGIEDVTIFCYTGSR